MKRLLSWVLISQFLMPLSGRAQNTGLVGIDQTNQIVLERDPNAPDTASGDTGSVNIKPQTTIDSKYNFEGFVASNVNSCNFSSLGDWWLRLETPEYREAYLALKAFEVLHDKAPFSNHLILENGKKFSDVTKEIAELLRKQREAETKKFKEMNDLFRCKCLSVLGATGIKDKDQKLGGKNYDHFINNCGSIDPSLTATIAQMKSRDNKGDQGNLDSVMEDASVGTLSYERKQVLLEWIKARMDYGFEMAGKYSEILEKLTELKSFIDSMEDPTNGWNYTNKDTGGASSVNPQGKLVFIREFTAEKKRKWKDDYNYRARNDPKINPHNMIEQSYYHNANIQYKYRPYPGAWTMPFCWSQPKDTKPEKRAKRTALVLSLPTVGLGVGTGVAIVGLIGGAAVSASALFVGAGFLFGGVATVMAILEYHYRNQITYDYFCDFFPDEFLESYFGETDSIIMEDIAQGPAWETTHNLLGNFQLRIFKKYAHIPHTNKVCGKEFNDPITGGKGFYGSNALCVNKVFRYKGSNLAVIENPNVSPNTLKTEVEKISVERLSRTYLVDPPIPAGAEKEWDPNNSINIAGSLNNSIGSLVYGMKQFATNTGYVKDHSVLKGKNKSTNDDKVADKYARISMADKTYTTEDTEDEMEDKGSWIEGVWKSQWTQVTKSFNGPSNGWNDISEFNAKTVLMPMEEFKPVNLSDNKYQYQEKMGLKVKEVIKNKTNEYGLFENNKDIDTFVNFVYDKHFIYPSISKPTYFRYPTQNGKAYWTYMVDMTTKYIMKIKELMGSSGAAVELYTADLIKTQQYQKLGGGMPPALASKNVKLATRAAKAFNGITLSDGKLNFGEFQKNLDAIKNENAGDGKLDAGKMDALNKANSAFRKVNEAKDKEKSIKEKRIAAGLPASASQEQIKAMSLPIARGVQNAQTAPEAAADSSPSTAAMNAFLDSQKKDESGGASTQENQNSALNRDDSAPTPAPSLGSLWGNDSTNTDGSGTSPSPIEGMTTSDVDHMLTSAEKEKGDNTPSDDDSLFTIVSKCYRRNLSSLLTKKNETKILKDAKIEEKLDNKKQELKNLLNN